MIFCEDGADLFFRVKGVGVIFLREFARLYIVFFLFRYIEFFCIRWVDKSRVE